MGANPEGIPGGLGLVSIGDTTCMAAFLLAFYERFGLNSFVQGDYAKAERWFRKLESKEADSLRVLRNLGVILLAKGDAEGAESYILKEERLYGQSFHRHSALGDIAYARGKRKEAERRYAAALACPEAAPDGRNSGSRLILERRREICSREDSFARSRESMDLFARGEAAREAGTKAAAAALFEEAALLDPTNWPALNNAGTIALNDLGEPLRARGLFERAFELARSPQVARNLELAEMAIAKKDKKPGAKAGAKGGRQ